MTFCFVLFFFTYFSTERKDEPVRLLSTVRQNTKIIFFSVSHFSGDFIARLHLVEHRFTAIGAMAVINHLLPYYLQYLTFVSFCVLPGERGNQLTVHLSLSCPVFSFFFFFTLLSIPQTKNLVGYCVIFVQFTNRRSRILSPALEHAIIIV